MPRYIGSPEQQDNSTFRRTGIDPLSVIYNQGQWRINKVSALYNLKYSAVKLKQYASKIKQTLVSNITTNSLIKYTVNVETDPNLKYSEEDADALLVRVSLHHDSSNPKVVYEAILLSWGVSNSVPEATHLPYMLERGEQKLGAVVKSSLATIFDCNIKQYCFTQHHLLQFGFSFIETETSSNSEKHVGFKFTSPQVNFKDSLTIHFKVGDVFTIWNGVKEEVNNKSELVNLTYQALQNQIFYMFVLDFTTLDLFEITLPRASVKSSGIVKMNTPDIVNAMFTVLNEISNVDLM